MPVLSSAQPIFWTIISLAMQIFREAPGFVSVASVVFWCVGVGGVLAGRSRCFVAGGAYYFWGLRIT